MKKFIAFITAVLLVFSLAACGEKPSGSPYTVELSRTEAEITEGDTLALSATVKENGEEKEVSVKWKSSDASVASVDNGTVTASGAGTATITAEYDGASAVCLVKVAKYYEPQMTVELNSSDIRFTALGRTASLSARAVVKGEKRDVFVGFTSSDPSVATVTSQGLVTAVAEGKTEIRARASYDGYYAESVCLVTVKLYAESVETESDAKYYVYGWEPDRSDGIPFAEEVVGVTDVKTGAKLPFDAENGIVKILTGNGLYGERRVAIEGDGSTLIVTGILVSGEIGTAEELVTAMNGGSNRYFVLAGDIDMTDYLAENPWSGTEAFFNKSFSGTLDGKGHSILNLKSTAGYIERTTNAIFKEITSSGTIRNLHLQASLGIKDGGGGGKRLSVLFGGMYGTLENCFFDLDVDFETPWKLYGGSPIWDLRDTSVVKNTAFYIPNADGLRCIVATIYGGAFESKGKFDNVAYIYKGIGYANTMLPTVYHPNLSNIYAVKADDENKVFTEFRKLDKQTYDNGFFAENGNRIANTPDYWNDTTAEEMTAAMDGFTFTNKALKFGNKTIFDFAS